MWQGFKVPVKKITFFLYVVRKLPLVDNSTRLSTLHPNVNVNLDVGNNNVKCQNLAPNEPLICNALNFIQNMC